MECAQEYDYIVTNRYVEETISAIEAIIEDHKNRRSEGRTSRNRVKISQK
jgi:guanylate kinase